MQTDTARNLTAIFGASAAAVGVAIGLSHLSGEAVPWPVFALKAGLLAGAFYCWRRGLNDDSKPGVSERAGPAP